MTEEEAHTRAQECARQGNLVEAGWVLTVRRGLPDGLSEAAVNSVRSAFYAGANHMLALMAGAQQRDDLDMQKVVSNLRTELDRFRAERRPKTPH